ncbi:hypothetical protein NM208_g11245 [Fusarium decemcellulare]|uniref:Uncharacterized protein n=1 Tax=Fusarium decemcellulare TaxID=57161 RepID=A0ACC1RV25_9HYPO|nr:hypothetical protein NM208_g11245 [Fusarium decemcellulare]
MNSHDALIDSCSRWAGYPCNLLRLNQLKSSLDRHRRDLVDNEKRLFNPDREDIHLLELNDGDRGYQPKQIQSSGSLRQHLLQNRKDSKCRFIFFQTEHSRSSLSCSRHSFSYTLSFYQVPPSFLDFVSSFGSTSEPLDCLMTGFHSDDTLSTFNDSLLEIPKLGRSGLEHRMQYLLRSVEPSTDDGEVKWNVRQMAVYHSYDFVEGRMLWINVKTNSLMRDRIQEATTELPMLRSGATNDVPKSFVATLATHIIHLEWCDNHWRQCINDMERKIQAVLVKAKTAQIDHPSNLNASTIQRALTIQRTNGSTIGLSEKSASATPKQGIWNLLKRLSPYGDGAENKDTLPHASPSKPMRKPGHQEDYNSAKQLDSLKILNTFSFGEMQSLHYYAELLEKYRLVMELSRQTLRDIAEHYQGLLNRDNLPVEIKENCKQEVQLFVAQVERIRKNLEIRITQVNSLVGWLQDGKALFDGILQYRSVQVGRIFTESSYLQSEKMERIAYKTEKETISMHIITCVTLAFLPGTFVAAFFQSGLIEINKDATGLANAVAFHPTAFKLFATICFPLMLLTFILWVLLFKYLSRRARGRLGELAGRKDV